MKLTASTSAFVMLGARFLKKMDVVLCRARVSLFSGASLMTDSALSSASFFSASLPFSVTFSTEGDLDFSLRAGDFSGVLDFDFDLDLRRVVVSPSSSELDEEELEEDELDPEEPGGAGVDIAMLIMIMS